MGERTGRLLALAIGTIVLVVFLWCVGHFMYFVGLDPLGVAFRFLALMFLGVAPIAGLWDLSQHSHEEGG